MAPAPTISPLERTLLTVCVMMATIMQALDTTIANVALPTIAARLDISDAASVWVVTAYQTALVVSLLPLAAWAC